MIFIDNYEKISSRIIKFPNELSHMEKTFSYDDAWHPRYLHYISAALVALYLTTNVVAAKQANLFGYTVTAGTLLFPFLLVIGDIMAEVYGYARSRKVILIGFFAMVFFSAITQLALFLPAAAAWTGQAAYQTVLGVIPRIAFASLVNYLLTDLVNAWVISKLKLIQGKTGFPLRAVASTVVAQALDGMCFYPLAFYGIIPTPILLEIIVTSWFIKVGLEIAALPITTPLVAYIKKLEGVEHFDGRPARS